jgi:polyphosphate kinase 2 (PPK2 family)
MSKKGRKNRNNDEAKAKAAPADTAPKEEMSGKEYAKALRKLHEELVAVQDWVKHERAKICILFEGRDGAGKGGMIKAITERVMGFTDEKQVRRFLDVVPAVEMAMVESDIILIKYWLEVSMAEQTRRLEDRINDARKVWKLSPMDLKSYNRWYDYSRARDDMFAATDTDFAPWYVATTDDKRRAHLNIISHLLSRIPYKPVPREKIRLPKRQSRGSYKEPDRPIRHIDEVF